MYEEIFSTKVPFFNTTVQTNIGDIGSYHRAHLYSLALVWDLSQIVQNFALFITSLTDEEDVSFLANIKSCDEGDEGDTEAVCSVVTSTREDPSAADKPLLRYISAKTASTLENLEFAIQILTGSCPSEKHIDQDRSRLPEANLFSNAFILLVEKHPKDSSVDLTLSLREDHGPAAAVSSLLQLAARYLALPFGSRSLDTEDNIEGTELPSTLSQLNFPPLYASPGPAVSSTAVDFKQPRAPVLLHTAFEQSVSQTPNAPAVDYLFTSRAPGQSVAHRTLTYDEVNIQATRVAHEVNLLVQELDWTAAWGEQRVIPVLIPPCPELYISILGILKAGHAFCPLPLDAPVQRIRDILDDIRAPAVLGLGASPWVNPEISPSQISDCPPRRDILWVNILKMQGWEAKSPNILPSLDPKATNHTSTAESGLAYVLYTSGSTGKPKGVLVSHHSVVCAISSHVPRMPHLPAGSQLRWFQMTSPTFDIFLLDMFLPLGLGGTLCTAERAMILTDVETAVDELQALATFSIPSFAMLFRPDRMPSLKTVVSGGEILNRRVIENYSKDCNLEMDRFLLNIYGPTECTISVTSESFSIHTRASIIGDLHPTASAFIIDPRSPQPKVLPLGLPGELAIGGSQVSLGYLNRVQETAKAFVTDPNFGRLYRTGDKVRVVWTGDGQPKLDYLGRLNTDQVKVNGRRVELGEIEAVVAKAQVVSEIAVVVSSTQIIACVIPRSLHTPESAESHCREVAREHLPSWMQPSKYLFWECLPRTANGKADRKAIALRVEQEMLLHESLATKDQWGQKEVGIDEFKVEDPKSWQVTPGIGGDSTRGSDVIDAMDVRSTVYQCLAAAINSDVGNWDGCTPLFQLGIDSLRAVLFLQMVRDQGVHELKIQDMLSGKTIHGLVHLVQERRQNVNQDGASTNPVPGKVFEKAVPCAPEITEAELSAIDDDELWEHPVQTRLLQFEMKCRPLCLQALSIPAQDVEQVLPTTSLQSRMTDSFIELNEDVNRYVEYRHVEHLVYRVPDSLQPTRLQQAVRTILNRHDCFRTVFLKVDHPLSSFAQVVLSPSSPAALLPMVEIICNKYDESPNSLWQHTVSNTQRSAEAALGLGRVGVVASYVLTPDHEHCVMILTLFHPIYDGVSLMYLREDIANEYHQPGILPQFHRLSIRKSVELNLEMDWLEISMFWMKRYGGVPPFRIGSKGPKAIPSEARAVSGTTFATPFQCTFLTLQLSMKELTAKATMNLSTTPMAVIQAAWAMTLASTVALQPNTSVLNIQFGNILHGRHNADAQQCMGPMVATVPLRVVFGDICDPRSLRTNSEICRSIVEQHAESIPFLQIPSLAFANAPLPFDTVLVLQTFEGYLDRDLPGFNRQENLLAPYKELDIGVPIMIEVWPGHEDVTKDLVLKCSYNTRCPGYEFVNAEWIQSIIEKMEELLVWIVNNPDASFDVHGN